jgi:hypothetical protein
MKYKNLITTAIPQDKREQVNQAILNDITGSQKLSKEQIFNAFTGKGKLHSLNFNNFQNFYEYSNSKKEFENGQYFTPDAVE